MITSNKKTQKKQEKDFAKRLDGKRQPFSGAAEFHKGDGITPDFLIEAKQTANQSLTLKLGWLEKIDAEAMAEGLTPLLNIEFLNANPRTTKKWVCVPEYYFNEMFDVVKEARCSGKQ